VFQDFILFFPDTEKLVPETATGGGHAVKLAGPVLADIPLALDPAVLLEPPEQGIEGVFLDI